MVSSVQTFTSSGYHLQTWSSNPGAPVIDKSLARGIRKAYFQKLATHHATYTQRLEKAQMRNQSPYMRIKSDKQLKDRLELAGRMLGPLLPVYSATSITCSKASSVILMLKPDAESGFYYKDSGACIEAMCFTRPGRLQHLKLKITVAAHVIDRVIQRAGLIRTPLQNQDISAINAELSDLLPVAILAARVLGRINNSQGSDEAARLQILIPNPHGVFLGKWSQESSQLVIQTFVDNSKLSPCQRQAAARIEAVNDAEIANQLVDAMTPGWIGMDSEPLKKLEQIWREYGWQFSEDRLHPGLSDAAWIRH